MIQKKVNVKRSLSRCRKQHLQVNSATIECFNLLIPMNLLLYLSHWTQVICHHINSLSAHCFTTTQHITSTYLPQISIPLPPNTRHTAVKRAAEHARNTGCPPPCSNSAVSQGSASATKDTHNSNWKCPQIRILLRPFAF